MLPADKMNLLNGFHDPNSFFGFNTTFQDMDADSFDQVNDRLLVEIGCKVFEVNKVHYRSTPSVQSRVNLEEFAM